eukprot:799909-Amphidinium_carterae.2
MHVAFRCDASLPVGQREGGVVDLVEHAGDLRSLQLRLLSSMRQVQTTGLLTLADLVRGW